MRRLGRGYNVKDFSKGRKRSSIRMNNFWKHRKALRRHCIASLVTKELDTRPYVKISVFDRVYLSLLDSGATIS